MLTHDTSALPALIQGGMGVAVSSWPLARAVAATGQLGVVSGTALDVVLARRLQDGDPRGHARAAMAASPVPGVAACVLDRYFRAGGREAGTPYAPVPRLRLRQGRHAQELAVVASFAEVWLARQGHHGPVGVNFFEKIQMATPAAAYGAMLAGAARPSWQSSPRTSLRSTSPAIPGSAPMGSSSRDHWPAATTHHRGAGSRWTMKATSGPPPVRTSARFPLSQARPANLAPGGWLRSLGRSLSRPARRPDPGRPIHNSVSQDVF